MSGRLNWLRAGVLGANDGIVSVSTIVVGVASAGTGTPAIITAGAAGLVGGAISMALGEYVSVSSQSDSQKALIEKERAELRDDPDGAREELVGLFEQHGLSSTTARSVAVELTTRVALRAHLTTELNISEDDVVSGWHAAWVSALAFTLGGILPFIAIVVIPSSVRIPITFVAVIIVLANLGVVGARLGGSHVTRGGAHCDRRRGGAGRDPCDRAPSRHCGYRLTHGRGRRLPRALELLRSEASGAIPLMRVGRRSRSRTPDRSPRP